MKASAFLIFFSIVLTIYFLVNFYIYRHGLMALPKGTQLRTSFVWIFWALAICFPLGRIVERYWTSPVTDAVVWVGSFWLAAMLYLFLIVLLVDIARLSNVAYPWMAKAFGDNLPSVRLWTLGGAAALVFLIIVIGHINAVWTRVSHYNISIAKEGGPRKQLRIVAASDIHMGTIIAQRRVGKLVRLINEQKPDIVLFAGDIVDEDLGPVIRRNLGRKLEQLAAKDGVYAITGNHEYIGGAEAAVMYLKNHGITVLRDSVALIDGSFYIAGRDDRESARTTGHKRKEVAELLDKVDTSKPIILLDHQPFELGKAAAANVDIQLSGHTHHGQLWPFNYLTKAIFEVSSGYLKKGNTSIIVSNGYGSWGPPVRIGNRPEIIVIDVTFTGAKR
ncbi:metallophosphoesterase [uncultured Acetobacteroides sp.]|uniref:metallophosphoesterase n=1 Tax=uncultured Acetobacteroides sp. TaxID=1760811 RepID=UPI0029F57C05|nr:metallophosphoesterase [uncultured Acetobacteroides sp.]